MTSALQKSRCCSAVSAAQHFENCSATSVFSCGMLQGWGLEGWGLGLADRFFLTIPELSVLKRCVPKTLAFAFGLRLCSKTQCFKTRVCGWRLPNNGKPQERLRFRALRGKTLAFKKRIAIVFCDLKPRCQGLRLGRLRSKNAAFCVCVSKPAKFQRFKNHFLKSGGVRVRFRVRSQAAKVPIFGGFPVENPTDKAAASQLFQGEILCPSTVRRGSEYG